MSASGREVAHRIFAAEYDDATHSYKESDEERAPNYVVTPTGARVNRLFVVGVLTEVESVSEDVLRARVADPTGVFVVYAGQYQPDAMAFLEDADPPLFVSVTGKARTFSPDDSDRVFTSVRPESINAVDADTRDRWTVQAAEQTLARVATARAAMDLQRSGDALRAALAESGVPPDLADGIPRAFDVYETTEHYLSAVADLAVDALELVADEAEEVPGLTVTPDDAGDGTVDTRTIAAGVDGAVVDLVDPDEVQVDEEDVADSESRAEPAEDADPEVSETPPEDGDGGTAGTVEADEPTQAADDDEPTGTADDEDELGDFEPGSSDGAADAAAEEPTDAATDEAAAGTIEEAADETTDTAADEPADGAADEMPADDVLDDEERERLEEEYGGFESGTEVDEPGEADIEPEAGPIEPEEEGGDDGTETAGEDVSSKDSKSETTADESEDDGDADQATGDDDESPDTPEDAAASGEPDAAEESDEDDAPDEDGDADAAAGEVDLEDAVMELMADLDEGDGADREELVAAVVDEHGVDPGAVEEAIQDALMAGKCYEPDDAHVKPI